MNDILEAAWVLMPSLAAGVLLGAMFFSGLLWTVRRGLASGQPALWFAGSQLVRTGLAVTGFLLVGRSDWRGMLMCLAGFVVARLVVIWLVKGAPRPASLLRGGGDAPHSR